MLSLFKGLCIDERTFRGFDSVVNIWLEDLESCGIDLFEYGREEKRLHGQNLMKDFQSPDPRYGDFYDWRLIGFDYGPSRGLALLGIGANRLLRRRVLFNGRGTRNSDARHGD